ncbi:MAG: PLP-dependent aspartate aminotransferase family protein [Planctomycetota bacterium]
MSFNSHESNFENFETQCIHGGLFPEEQFGSLSTPVYLTSTFVLEGVGKDKGYDYSRTGNPTRTALAQHLAVLEGGVACSVHGTGIASITTVLHHFKAGDHILVTQDCYGGTHRLISQNLTHFGLEADFVDFTDVTKLEAHVKPNTKAIWVESPTNPVLKLCDLEALGTFSKKHNLTYIVDNTFASPAGQNPIKFGADLVVHSTTKYINGHCDCTGGAVISRTKAWGERIAWLTNCLGTGQSPFDSWQILRGSKTLSVRYKAQQASAASIAQWLESHPAVAKVHFPGLKSHPQHELAKRQQKGFGAIIAFEVRGTPAEARAVVENTKLIKLAESLGGVQSLIEVPAFQSHASMTPQARINAGISDTLVRFSVGLEDSEDLIRDLDQALSKVGKGECVLTAAAGC